jgi:hypothetical protein
MERKQKLHARDRSEPEIVSLDALRLLLTYPDADGDTVTAERYHALSTSMFDSKLQLRSHVFEPNHKRKDTQAHLHAHALELT